MPVFLGHILPYPLLPEGDNSAVFESFSFLVQPTSQKSILSKITHARDNNSFQEFL